MRAPAACAALHAKEGRKDGRTQVFLSLTAARLRLLSQVMAALSVSLGSMVVGFASGYTAPALASMERNNETMDFIVSKEEVSRLPYKEGAGRGGARGRNADADAVLCHRDHGSAASCPWLRWSAASSEDPSSSTWAEGPPSWAPQSPSSSVSTHF